MIWMHLVNESDLENKKAELARCLLLDVARGM